MDYSKQERFESMSLDQFVKERYSVVSRDNMDFVITEARWIYGRDWAWVTLERINKI